MISEVEVSLKRQIVRGNSSVCSKYGSIISLSTTYSTWNTLLQKPVILGEKSRYVTVESEINIDNCAQWGSMSSGVKKVKTPFSLQLLQLSTSWWHAAETLKAFFCCWVANHRWRHFGNQLTVISLCKIRAGCKLHWASCLLCMANGQKGCN